MCMSMMTGNLTSGGGNLFDVFTEDPNSMPGQGLARTDNYRTQIADRDYGALLDTYLNSENQDQILAAEQKYKPQYIDQDLANTRRAMGGTLDLVSDYMPQLQATQRAMDPKAAQLTDIVMQQAIEEMMAGSRLTPAQQRQVQQNSRVAMAARGMGGTNAALADELLKQYDLGENAKAGRRQFAMSALGLNKNLQAGQTPQDWLTLALNTGRTATATMLPFAAQTQLLNSVYGENQSNNRAQAELETKMGMDQADKWNSWGSMGVGMTGGGGGGGGGGGMDMCWVAREVFGATNPQWLAFRAWLLQDAPAWFRELYRRHGERLAGWLKDKPRCKQIIRGWMTRRIQHRKERNEPSSISSRIELGQ